MGGDVAELLVEEEEGAAVVGVGSIGSSVELPDASGVDGAVRLKVNWLPNNTLHVHVQCNEALTAGGILKGVDRREANHQSGHKKGNRVTN